jgi:hypothetical protein
MSFRAERECSRFPHCPHSKKRFNAVIFCTGCFCSLHSAGNSSVMRFSQCAHL